MTRPRLIPLVLAFAVAAHAAAAQSVVAGRVTVLERSGGRTEDLGNAVVWLEPANASYDAPIAGPVAAPPTTAEFVMEQRRFRPAARVVPVGSELRFANYDPFRHNVFSDAGPSKFDVGLYGRGETRAARAKGAGVYPVFCNIHARMVAYVVAVPSRWFAQAAPDGTYEIADVPPGHYRLYAWHDRGGQQMLDVRVAAMPSRVVVDPRLDARGWRDVAHKNKYGRDYPPESRDRY